MRPRTRAGRLAALDAWLVACEPQLLDGRGALVDVGYGEHPTTTLEWAQAARQVNPAVRVVGVERGAASHPDLELVQGDFATCATLGPTAVVRALNVLRGYREEEVEAAHEALGAGLVEGGLVLEGSTDTEGHVTVVHLIRRRQGLLAHEALLFHTDFTRGFSPWLFRDWLPRALRRRCTPGTAVHTFLTDWAARAEAVATKDPKQRFTQSAHGSQWERSNGFARALLPLP